MIKVTQIPVYLIPHMHAHTHTQSQMTLVEETGEKIVFDVSLDCYIIGVVQHSGPCVKCDLYIRWTSGSIDLDLG